MLITLTIIGIIAALTVPSLMTKVQDHGFRSAFLKNYAIIKNAYAKSMSDGVPFYDPSNKHWTINPIYIDDLSLIKNYFKIQKGPYYQAGGVGTGTFKKFYLAFTPTNTLKYLNGTYVSNFLLNGAAYTFQLTDGTIISFCSWSNWVYNIFIDVNGSQGPNTYGRDIYWLQAPWDSTLGRQEIHPLGDKYTGDVNIANTNNFNNNFVNTCVIGKGNITEVDQEYSGATCGYEIIKNKAYKIPKE